MRANLFLHNDLELIGKRLLAQTRRLLGLEGIDIMADVMVDVILYAEAVQAISSVRVETIHSQAIRN